MGKLLRYGRQVMATMEAVTGAEELMEEIVTRVADGEDPKQIAESWGIVVSALWEWMHTTGSGRVTRYRHALKMRADALAHQSLRDIEVAPTDGPTVSLAKIRADHRLKMAGKWDQDAYGEGGKPSGGGTGITVVVDRGFVHVRAPDGSGLTVAPEPAGLEAA